LKPRKIGPDVAPTLVEARRSEQIGESDAAQYATDWAAVDYYNLGHPRGFKDGTAG
jgi:hypothetical protein